MKKIKFLALALLATLTVGLTSCNKDDKIQYDGTTLFDGDFIEKEDFGTDPTASYKLHFKFGYDAGDVEVIGLDSPGLIEGITNHICETGIAIMDYGKCSGLSKMETYPNDDAFKVDGKYVINVKAEKKHGYIIKVWGAHNLDEYHVAELHDPKPAYIRLWIEELEGSMQFRYEYPWVPAEN